MSSNGTYGRRAQFTREMPENGIIAQAERIFAMPTIAINAPELMARRYHSAIR